MPARETEAIILKTFPLGEADRLVSFLGRTSGRLRGVAGGSLCSAEFGAAAAYHAPWEPGLLCEKCRRPGMKPLHLEAGQLAERFTSERLDRIENAQNIAAALKELREAALNWIEHN